MNTLLVYDSQFGNTKAVAEVIAAEVEATTVRAQDFNARMLDGLDLLIVGCPIHGWRPTEATMALLGGIPAGTLTTVRVAAFDTRIRTFFSGDASKKILSRLVALGGTAATTPACFYVDGSEGPLSRGELDRARTWARSLTRVTAA